MDTFLEERIVHLYIYILESLSIAISTKVYNLQSVSGNIRQMILSLSIRSTRRYSPNASYPAMGNLHCCRYVRSFGRVLFNFLAIFILNRFLGCSSTQVKLLFLILPFLFLDLFATGHWGNPSCNIWNRGVSITFMWLLAVCSPKAVRVGNKMNGKAEIHSANEKIPSIRRASSGM